MITFEVAVDFIKKMAALYPDANEEWDYEYLESETFRKIIEFAAAEKDAPFQSFVKEMFNKPGDEGEPDFNDYGNMMDMMDKYQEQNLLSERTSELYALFLNEFWGHKQPLPKDYILDHPIPTGLAELDKVIGGWSPSDLILLGGSPGMGKTAMMLSFARKAARRGIPVCIYSLAQSSQSLVGRMLFSSFDEPPNPRGPWSFSPIDWRKLTATAEDLARILIYFDDNAEATMDYITERSQLMHRTGLCEMIMIDDLQLINFDKSESDLSRSEKNCLVVKRAKLLADTLKIPVMLLTDLGRWVAQRLIDSRPRLTDLSWARFIEPYADIILLGYRPAQHRIYIDDTDNSTLGKGEIIIAKNRGKETGKILFKHNKGMSRIEDAGDDEQV